MEVKNKLTVTRGDREGNSRERRGRVKSKNRYKGPMVKDNGVGIVFGSGGWMGHGRATGGKNGTTVTEQQQINK